MYAAQLVIQAFGPAGGIGACVPAPYELLQKYEVPSVKEALTRSREDRLPNARIGDAKGALDRRIDDLAKRTDDLQDTLTCRIDDMRDMLRAEFRRVEEAWSARLKYLEAREH